MAVAPHFSGFSPTPEDEPTGVALIQEEAQSYTLLDESTFNALTDLRTDADHALQRISSFGFQDPDLTDVAPIGASMARGEFDFESAEANITLIGHFNGETDQSVPSYASITTDLGGDADILFEARLPGSGNDDFPYGNRIIVTYDDRDGAAGQPLECEGEVITLGGKDYYAVVFHLATDGGGTVTTIANDIVDMCDPTDPSFDANEAGGWYLTATATGTGLDLVSEPASPWQLSGGDGGLYCVYMGDPTSGWIEIPTKTWAATQIELFPLMANNYQAADVINFMVLCGGVAVPFSVLVCNLWAVKTDGTERFEVDRTFQISGGYNVTWDTDHFAVERSTSAGADSCVVPFEFEQRDTTTKGKFIDTFQVVYSIESEVADDVTVEFYEVNTPLTGVAQASSALGFSYDEDHDTAGERGAVGDHTMTCTLDTQQHVGDGCSYLLVITVDDSTGGGAVFKLFGGTVNFTTVEDF